MSAFTYFLKIHKHLATLPRSCYKTFPGLHRAPSFLVPVNKIPQKTKQNKQTKKFKQQQQKSNSGIYQHKRVLSILKFMETKS